MRVRRAQVVCEGGPGLETPSADPLQKMQPWPCLTPRVDGSGSGFRLWLEIEQTRLRIWGAGRASP